MKKIIAAGLGMLAIAAAQPTSAIAADMPVKARPAYVDPWSWTGIYVGLNAGYSWGRSRTHVDYYTVPGGLLIAPPAGSIVDNKFNLNGGVAGGQIGANFQSDRWLIGVEADLQWSGQKGSAPFSCALVTVGVPGVCAPGVTAFPPGFAGASLSLDQKLEWFGTVRGRLGALLSPTVVAYVTGGLAYGEIETSGLFTAATPAVALSSVAFSHSQTKAGWTVGGGLEGRLWGNWTGKVEYLYMDLGTVSGSVINTPAGIRADYSSRITDNIVRVGINYKFDPAIHAKY